jgi:uncharacterized membrane protein
MLPHLIERRYHSIVVMCRRLAAGFFKADCTSGGEIPQLRHSARTGDGSPDHMMGRPAKVSGSEAAQHRAAGQTRAPVHGFYRFHLPHAHLASVFGDDWFALKAEGFARFFGTPKFLIGQTVIVAIWMLINIVGWWVFDQYPFILLNLAFSLQAAYAAPLILLAQTRQADRDKATAVADAQHREDLHQVSEERQRVAAEQRALLVHMLEQNTQLTQAANAMAKRIEILTAELHKHILEAQPGR